MRVGQASSMGTKPIGAEMNPARAGSVPTTALLYLEKAQRAARSRAEYGKGALCEKD